MNIYYGREGWKTIREAIKSGAKTKRLALLMMAGSALPAAAIFFIIMK